MADVPYQAYLPAGLTAYSDPLNRRDWGKTTAGVVTVGGLWLGYSKITDPVWPSNNKVYWVKGTLPEYVPDEPEPDPDPTIYVTHRIETYSDGSITVDGVFVPNK